MRWTLRIACRASWVLTLSMGTCPQCLSPVMLPEPYQGYCSLGCRTRAVMLAHVASGKRKPAKRVARPAKPTEAHEQLQVARWLEAANVLYCHPPNGELRAWSVARRLKAMGVKPGVPDILIFTPPPNQPMARGVAIELKRQGVNTCSPQQRDWQLALADAGWLVGLCPGATRAIEWLESLGFACRR